MAIDNEIEAAFEKAGAVSHDLRDAQCKKLCDELTALSWRVLTSGVTNGHISEELFRKALQQTADFPHLNSRIYEVVWLYRLRLMAVDDKFDPEQALKLLQNELASHAVPTKPNLVLQGLCEYKLRGLHAAQYYFLRANQEYISDSIITSFFAYSRSVCPLASVYHAEDVSVPQQKVDSDGKTWLLVAANSTYVGKFLKNYVDSIVKQPHNIGLHLHWVLDAENMSEDALAQEALEYAKSQLNEAFEISTEICPKVRDKRSYFASSRFLVANDLLRSKGKIIITDIDYEIVGDLSAFCVWCDQYDVSLQVRDNGLQSYFPWLKVLAGTVVVNNSPLGRRFLDMYAFCFSRTYVASGFNWGVDQNILCALYDELKRFGCIGNSLSTTNPFTVPYEIKKGS